MIKYLFYDNVDYYYQVIIMQITSAMESILPHIYSHCNEYIVNSHYYYNVFFYFILNLYFNIKVRNLVFYSLPVLNICFS